MGRSRILNPGTGFSVDQVFALSTPVRLADNSVVNLTLNLKFRLSVLCQFCLVVTLKTLSEQVIHSMDIELPALFTLKSVITYHVAYLDGDGSDFVKIHNIPLVETTLSPQKRVMVLQIVQ